MEISKIKIPSGNSTVTVDIKDATARAATSLLGTASVKDVPTSGNASSTQVVMGDDTRLSDSRPASDVYSWAKATNKPSYKMGEIESISVVALTAAVSSVCSITGAANDGNAQTIIYTNSSGSDKIVTVPTTYKTPDGDAIEITVPNGGYCEVSYVNVSGTIYARGL